MQILGLTMPYHLLRQQVFSGCVVDLVALLAAIVKQ